MDESTKYESRDFINSVVQEEISLGSLLFQGPKNDNKNNSTSLSLRSLHVVGRIPVCRCTTHQLELWSREQRSDLRGVDKKAPPGKLIPYTLPLSPYYCSHSKPEGHLGSHKRTLDVTHGSRRLRTREP